MFVIDLASQDVKTRAVSGKRAEIYDVIRKKWMILTPEEHVRQALIHYLLETMKYPQALIAVERQVKVGRLNKRFDVVVYHHSDHKPWLLAECKAPEVEINAQTLQQLLNYNSTLQCRYWLLTNGRCTWCADATDPQHIAWIPSMPSYY